MMLRRYCTILLFVLAVSGTGIAHAADTVIRFMPVPTGLSARLIYDTWKHAPEYAELVRSMDMPPAFMMARGDVNEDGADEIFARHSDSDLVDYCPGFGAECLLIIYKNAKGQLVEIGRMYSSQDVVVLPQTRMGYHDLRIERANKTMMEYRWNGQTYQQK